MRITIEKELKLQEDHARELLRNKLIDHELKTCDCDLKDHGFGFCYAQQWLEGIISSKMVIQDFNHERKN